LQTDKPEVDLRIFIFVKLLKVERTVHKTHKRYDRMQPASQISGLFFIIMS